MKRDPIKEAQKSIEKELKMMKWQPLKNKKRKEGKNMKKAMVVFSLFLFSFVGF